MSTIGDQAVPDVPLPLPGDGELLLRPIPAGDGWIGSRGDESDEQPRHRVSFAKPFYLGKFVVTQAEWRAVVEVTPELREGVQEATLPADWREQLQRWWHRAADMSPTDFTKQELENLIVLDSADENLKTVYFQLGQYFGEVRQEGAPGPDPSKHKGERYPVEQVSWDDAEAWLTAWAEWVVREQPESWLACRLREGWELRLPRELEWEYACRAGSETAYWNGDGEAALAEITWYEKNAGGKTHDVDEWLRPGQGEDHPWGLAGMHGNVWEWCGDVYRAGAYRGRVRGDGAYEEQGEAHDGQHRVMRGGSWDFTPARCRSAYRNRDLPGNRIRLFGFRVCLAPGLGEAERNRSGGDEAGHRDGGGVKPTESESPAQSEPAEGWDGARLPRRSGDSEA